MVILGNVGSSWVGMVVSLLIREDVWDVLKSALDFDHKLVFYHTPRVRGNDRNGHTMIQVLDGGGGRGKGQRYGNLHRGSCRAE
ncbi:hypothetical protein B9Z19DRAFT_1087670 [Tuber borchii]|uniref:Uncharacterized protein n=1 Tax=Tuber borchii TaxID=42251 RepID=A0A2T6ZMV6_TUBBO|nr:hypothetical protein B9Z19DRAFT_1087670 [Tuber borchii]